MQAGSSSASTSLLAHNRSLSTGRGSLHPYFSAGFRASLEDWSGEDIYWGYWSDGEHMTGSLDCLVLRGKEEYLFRKSDFVIAPASEVKDALKCLDTAPDADQLMQLFLEADELYRLSLGNDLRYGFFLAGKQSLPVEEMHHSLRAAGLHELITGSQLDNQPDQVWCFCRKAGQWELRSFSIRTFLDQASSVEASVSPSATPGREWQNEVGQTQLHEAILSGDGNQVKKLLASGMSPSGRDHRFNSPLHLAAEMNQPETVRLLLAAGASWRELNYRSRTPLHVAAAASSAESLATLLDAGAEPDVLMDRGISPLHVASWHGDADMVYLLIQAGASINLLNEDGNSCLHLAAGNGQVKIVKSLMSFGADPALENHRGLTYLEVINEGYSGPSIPVL